VGGPSYEVRIGAAHCLPCRRGRQASAEVYIDCLASAAAATRQLKDGEEDVDGVEIDGEGERDGGAAVSPGADSGEVSYGEQGEDAEGEPGVRVRREEVEEHAGHAGDDEQQQRGKADSGDAAVVDVEQISDAAHDGHAASSGGGGVEDEAGAEVMDVTLDERPDLPAHEIGEDEKHAERDGRAGLAGEADGEDKPENDDEADEGSPCGRGGDTERRDEEAQRGDGEHLGEQGGGLLAGDVDGVVVGVAQVVVVHCHAFRSSRVLGEGVITASTL
jgi:hypothetical protein